MNIWKQVEIKTKYNAKSEGIENCRDIKKMTTLGYSFFKKISGLVDESGDFILSSLQYGANNYLFCGKFEERNDGIYMVGEIRPRNWLNITLKTTRIRNVAFVLVIILFKYLLDGQYKQLNLQFAVFEFIVLYLMLMAFSIIFGRLGYRGLLRLIKQKVC